MNWLYFTSKLKRMPVVVKNPSTQAHPFYLKGVPEIVTDLCRPETVPSNINSVISHYTRLGYRVMTFAYKSLNTINFNEFRASRI